MSARFSAIHKCQNAGKALAILRETKIDLVLTDIVMPEMDGYGLCAEMKKTPGLETIPVILLTSLTNPLEVARGLECGADNFLFKPYSAMHLYSVIDHTLGQRGDYEDHAGAAMEITFSGQKFSIRSGRRKIVNLLLTTYQSTVNKNLELEQAQRDLRFLANSLEELVTNKSVQLEEALAKLKAADAASQPG